MKNKRYKENKRERKKERLICGYRRKRGRKSVKEREREREREREKEMNDRRTNSSSLKSNQANFLDLFLGRNLGIH